MANESVRPLEIDDDMVREWNQMRLLVNELKADFIALLAKLDADAGVTDVNYASTLAIAAADVDSFSTNY